MKLKQLRSPNEVVNEYLRQLQKFRKLGIGKKTENGVTVTQALIDITKKRMQQLAERKIKDEG